jgi:predicted Zn finger-like uncharacterized protein
MDVICEGCHAKINVPEDKLPEGKRVSIRCPKCQSRIAIPAPSEEEDTVTNVEVTPEKNPSASEPKESIRSSQVDDSFLEFYEEGVKLALVLEHNPEDLERARQAVEESGYRFVTAENTRAAVGKMRLYHFDMICLSDQFDDIDLKQSPVLQYLNNLSMSVRRKVFLVVIGEEFKTLDNMMAFAMSANLVVSRRDMDKFTAILKQAVSDHQRFYKVFLDTMREVGKV